MLSINPKMMPRLDEIEEDLLARRKWAVAETWQGEIEGIDLTLTFLHSKREPMKGLIAQVHPVHPGLLQLPRDP
jgi:hypothetical protein